MAFVLEPPIPSDDLHGRLDVLRRQMQRTALLVGGASLIAAVVGFVLLVGLADAALHLPAPLRAVLLLVGVVGVVLLTRRWVWAPWRAAGDDVALALQVQRHFPGLVDSLASAVQFSRVENDRDLSHGSPGLRDAAVRYAVERTEMLDFGELAEGRPVGRSLFLMLVALATATALFIRYSGAALLCLARLFDPYGEHPWPPQTRLTVTAATMLARGEPFELSARLQGVIPDRAVLNLALDGAATTEQVFSLTPEPKGDVNLPVKIEPTRAPRNFRYRFTANDSTTGWREVTVNVPPQLAPLDGRPSPRLRLDYPRYTDLPPVHLPDGAGAIECVVGTTISLRAATDRPVVSAAVVYQPRDPRALGALAGLPFAGWGCTAALATLTAPHALTIEGEGQHFSGRFTPAVGGVYELTFADASGLAGHRPLDVRLLPDPSPAVNLDRPSVSSDSLEVTPGATVTLHVVVEDPMFAVRRVAVEYRTASHPAPRQFTLYDGDSLGTMLPKLLTASPTPAQKLRPTRLAIERRLPLSLFGEQHKPGDVLGLSVVAVDFDDVTPDKPPGRSHEVELRIVSPERLDATVQEQRQRLTKSLEELHRLQAEALAQAQDAERQRRATGAPTPADAEKINQAEAAQQRIQERLADERDGAKAQAERLRQTLANHPGASLADRDKAQRLAAELDRIGNDVLEPVGPLLSAGRKETPPLHEALRRQREAERSLGELAGQARNSAAAEALAVEASNLANEQQQLNREREQAAAKTPPGADPSRLTDKQREELNQLKERQHALAKRAAAFGEQLDRRTDDAKQAAGDAAAAADAAQRATQGNFEPKTAENRRRDAERAKEQAQTKADEARKLAAARDAAKQGDAGLAEQMNRAAQALGANQLGEAQRRQENAARQLDAVRETLRPSPEEDVDRLTKERQRADEEVNQIIRDQEALQDRTLAAEAANSRQQKEQAAREQDALVERARQAARELHRQGQTDAAHDLERAARDMERARDQLASGDRGADAQDDALDRLDDAAGQTARARHEADEQLQREKFVKLAVRVKGLTERQAALAAEGRRLFDNAKTGWSRSQLKSLADLGRDEQGLAKEVEKLAAENLQSLKVLKRLAEQAAEAMSETATAIEDAKADGLTAESLAADRLAIRAPQDLAAKRLKQLLAAVAPPKEPEKKPDTPEQAKSDPAKPNENVEQKPPPPPRDGVPALAQLVVLRDLQAEVNERTAAFGKAHPNPEKWTPAQRREIDKLRRMQAELAELLIEMLPDDAPAPERKP